MNNHKAWNDLCWYLLQAYPKHEDRVEGDLKSLGIEILAPKVEERQYNYCTGAIDLSDCNYFKNPFIFIELLDPSQCRV